jgi:ATP/maltotriose-dependent transcriptional regulator MalT
MGVLAEVEYRLGGWNRSLNLAEQALSLAEDSEQRWVQGYLHAAAVGVCAGRGWWSRAQDHLDAGQQLAKQLGDPATWAVCESMAVHLAFCRGEPDEVVERSQLLLGLGGPTEEPGWLGWPVQLCSALVQVGRLDDAEAEVVRLEAVASERGSRSRLAGLARVRGELFTARRDHASARTAFEEALELGDAADVLERGLVRAAYGRFLRRRGEVRTARAQLEDASERFRALGATPFVEGCAEELAACGGTSDPSLPPDLDQLTPQERLVVRLACDGLANQEIARQLVLSVKTIGYHLGNAYAKLGVHSRAQLVAKLGASVR